MGAMLVERIWAGNAGRNFSYLVACADTGEALVIDPYNADQCLTAAAAHRWRITQVLNTHEHGDHTRGNAGVRAATGAKLLAHARAEKRIGRLDRALAGGDAVAVGSSVRLDVLDTPGHTMSHVCLLADGHFFSGDTLFNAGVGKCDGAGDPAVLFKTFATVIATLADDVRVCPGHDYLRRNLGFTLDREPGNRRAGQMLERIENAEGAHAPFLTLGAEREINVFLRVQEPEVVARAGAADPTPREVFLALRARRDRW